MDIAELLTRENTWTTKTATELTEADRTAICRCVQCKARAFPVMDHPEWVIGVGDSIDDIKCYQDAQIIPISVNLYGKKPCLKETYVSVKELEHKINSIFFK